MKTKAKFQYTIRGVPPQVDQVLREKSHREHKSLNQLALEALQAVAGQATGPVRHRDLDFMIGTWVEDPEFDAAIRAQDVVDEGKWR